MTTTGSILNNRESVLDAVSRSTTIKEALILLGLRAAGGNYQAFRKACLKHSISLAHFPKGRQLPGNKIPNEEVFIQDSLYENRTSIKKRLINDYGWEWRCMNTTCPSPNPDWDNRPLVLQLEHINGIHNDNRLENLMFLCPNCHSQTDTYCGKSKVSVCSCGERKSRRASNCKSCASSGPRRKHIEWPTVEVLIKLVESEGFSGAGRLLGVSDNAVRKHLKTASRSAGE